MRSLLWSPRFDGADLMYFRLGGPGLGNLLFPWARALLYRGVYGGRLIFPTWRQLKIGPLIRRETDLRTYSDLFVPAMNDVRGIERYRYKFAKRCDEDSWSAKRGVVEVRGMRNHFDDLREHRALVVRELRLRSASHWEKGNKANCYAIHVRLGDFAPAGAVDSPNRQSNASTPLEWYLGVMRLLITHTSGKIAFELHTDGTDEEVAALLSLPEVTRVRGLNAWESIVSISRCVGLIASGSTFSMWGAFLGGLPSLYFPGQLKQPVLGDGAFEREAFLTDISKGFLDQFLDSRRQ